MTEAMLASRLDERLVCEADPFAAELTSTYAPSAPVFAPGPAKSSAAASASSATPAYLRPPPVRGRLSGPDTCVIAADGSMTFLEEGPEPAGSPMASAPPAPLPLYLRKPAPAQGDQATEAPGPRADDLPASKKPPAPATKVAPVAQTDDRAGKQPAKDTSDDTGQDDGAADGTGKKDKPPKPGDAAPDEADGAAAKDAKGGPAAKQDKAKGAAGKKAKGRAKADGEEGREEGAELPAIDTASPSFSRAPIRQTERGEAFRPAEPPAFRVQPRAGGKPEPPSPQRAQALALFREAMAQTAKLHAAFLAAAEQATSSVQATEASLASQAQGDLDRGLMTLRVGLDQARLELDLSADAADAFIKLRSRQTYGAINALAKSAGGTLDDLKEGADDTFKAHDADRTKKKELADAEAGAVTGAGTSAADAVTGLDASKEKDFPYDGEPMEWAINEAVVMRMPKRSKERAKTYTEERDAQSTHLSNVFKQMADALATQFPLIKKAMDDTAKSAQDSIIKSRDAARKQLAKGVRDMHRSVAQARAGGHAALVEQHNMLRRQMVGSHRDRAMRENAQAQQRAARGTAVALNAAKAQQTGADSLGEALAKEAARPPDDLAKVMSSAAGGLLRQSAKSGPEQRDRIDRSVRAGEDDARAQSQALGARLDGSATDSAGQLQTASRSAGKGIDDQVKAGVKPFGEIPGQVTAALRQALPTTTEAYQGLNEGTDEKPGAGKMILSAQKTIDDTLAGKGGGGNTPAPTPAPAPADGKSKGPKEKPAEFRDRAKGIADKPLTEDGIKALVATAAADLPPRIDDKVGKLYDALQQTSTNVESVMVQLRGLTKQQGRALSAVYKNEKGKDLASHLRSELNKFFSADYTNQQNIAAALAYLAGDTVNAAKHELKAAVYLWNDTGRSEKVLRALTPEELDKLNTQHPDVMADVSGDLGEGEKEIFDALKQIKPVANLEGDALKKQLEANYKLLGEANAHALKRDLDQALETKGEEGGDKVTDTVSTAYQMAGSDAIAGGDGAYENPDEAEARREAVWKETKTSFEDVAKKLPDGSPNVQADEGPKLGAIARYAAAARERTEFVPNEGPRGGGHYRTVKKGLDPRQARLIDDIVNTGPNSEDTAASTIEFETNRKEGKPREDRLRKALLGEDLMGAREGESDADRTKRLKERRDPKDDLVGDEARVKARKENILKKVAERRAEGQQTADGRPVEPVTPAEVQKQITDQLETRFAGDPTGAAYTKSMIESDTFEPDPQKAFDFALAHDERNKETLKATTERMNRDQIKDSVAKWDEGKPESDRLYNRLGLYKKGGAKLEGDAKNETELSFRGKPRNDKEKALIAVFVVEQQRRDSTAAGRGLAGSDYDRMVAKQEKVLKYMGIERDQIDETGDIKATGPDGKEFRGKFDENGRLVLDPRERRDFESAMRFSHMNAESYKQAVDRISQGIVMALIVAAAIITTFVTFGGAAAIWGPILITAAAGFAGMAMTAAIRGDRYTSAEMQRDFVMTLVQAGTAGLGAAIGAGAKGAGAAAKGAAAMEKGAETAAKAASATQKLASGAAGVGTKQGMSFGAKALQFGKEVVVGGTTNSINSFAAAAMDPENRRQGKALSKGIDGGVKGFLSGSLGAAVTKPMSALGRPLGKTGERMAGNVGSGFTQRLAEARIGQAMGDPHQSWAESIEGAKEGIAQDAIQAFGEQRAENAAARRAARKAQAAARANAPDGPPARPSGEAPHLEGPAPPAKRVPDDDGVARAQAVKEAIPPEVRPIAEAAAAQAGPPAANDNDPALPVRRAAGDADDGLRMRTQRRDDEAPRLRTGGDDADPNEITQKLPIVDLSDDAPITRRETKEEREAPISKRELAEGSELPTGKRGLAELNADPDPRPKPIVDTIDLTPEMLRQSRSIPENSRITATDPHSEAAAHANYHAMREQDVHREVLLAKCVDPSDERYGQYMVIQGDPDSVRRPPPGWVTERHSHPLQFEVATAARLVTSLPSGEGADFGILRQEVDMLSGLVNSTKGIKRESVIDVRLGDQLVETHFSITRNGDAYEYRVSFRPPHDGVDKLGPFYSLADYEAAATNLTGQKWGTGRKERMHTADAMGTVSASPPRAVHGEPITPSMRQDIDFVAGRMALAGEFEAQAAGTRPRGELDPKLGRAATLSDAHERVTRMGLVGEPDSMIRLHNILNDDNIPIATRALISDVTLAATRNHLLETGQLAPGEPLVMLFHGATPERTHSLVKEGIDMARRPGGPNDDFGQGLYFTKSFESALQYTKRGSGSAAGDAAGGVVPYMLRGRDLGNSVDVSTGGKLRAQWEAFAVANAMTLYKNADMAATPTFLKVLRGEPIRFTDFGPADLGNRGALFDDFLASIGARPDVIFGDLGGPLTSGISLAHVTDQAVVRSPAVAEIMNRQHVRPGTADADVTRGGPHALGAAGDDAKLRTLRPVRPGPAPGSAADPAEIAARARTGPAVDEINAAQAELSTPSPIGARAAIAAIRAGGPDAAAAQAHLNTLYDTPKGAVIVNISDARIAGLARGLAPGKEHMVKVEGMWLRLYRAQKTDQNPNPPVRYDAVVPLHEPGAPPRVYQFGDGELRVWRGPPTSDEPAGQLRQSSLVGPGKERMGLEENMFSHGESHERLASTPVGPQAAGYHGPALERGHLHGAGLGVESPFGIGLVPREVNQTLQNRGIEGWMRRMRDALPPGAELIYSTDVSWHQTSNRHSRIGYKLDLVIQGQRVPFAEFAIHIEADPPGTKQAQRRGTRGVFVSPLQFHGSEYPRVDNYLKALRELVDTPAVLHSGLPRSAPDREQIGRQLHRLEPEMIVNIARAAEPWELASHNPPAAKAFRVTQWEKQLKRILAREVLPRYIVVDLRGLGLGKHQKEQIGRVLGKLSERDQRRILLLDDKASASGVLSAVFRAMLLAEAAEDDDT